MADAAGEFARMIGRRELKRWMKKNVSPGVIEQFHNTVEAFARGQLDAAHRVLSEIELAKLRKLRRKAS